MLTDELCEEAGLLYVGVEVLVAEVFLLTDEDLEDVLRDTDALRLVLLLVPIPLLTEFPLLTDETLLLLPAVLLDVDLMWLPSVPALRPWYLSPFDGFIVIWP